MKRKKILQKCLIGIFFIIAGVIYLGTSITKEIHKDTDLDHNTVAVVNSDTLDLSESVSEETLIKTSIITDIPIEPTKKIVVHVCGCVVQPDVYELQLNARLIDAVKAADGFTKDAATDCINQAQLLIDGQRIYIPSIEEIEKGLVIQDFVSENQNSAKNQRVNINCATKEELMTLPGIGEAKAERIIAYRDEHNGFQTIEDIQQIAGVKEATFLNVKDLITIE